MKKKKRFRLPIEIIPKEERIDIPAEYGAFPKSLILTALLFSGTWIFTLLFFIFGDFVRYFPYMLVSCLIFWISLRLAIRYNYHRNF